MVLVIIKLMHFIFFISSALDQPVEQPQYFKNLDLESVVTPVNIKKLEELLIESNYSKEKTQFLVNSFKWGFDLGYRGPMDIQRKAPNLKLRVGNPTVLWNKVMKEVKNKRYAGPFGEIPFTNFIQSSIGLVPKDGGKDTRLIFHLSYPRDGDSVNSCTPKEFCSVNYPSFDNAVRRCDEEFRQFETNNELVLKEIYVGKSDWKSAFRNLGMLPKHFCYLIMKAKDPVSGKTFYFIDKCLPFGASISCAHFQNFSDAMAHVMMTKLGKRVINYLDDFLFVAYLRSL